ncbi:stimulator of interferon genes protein-like [Xenia sp. Carnegie-2017]|uniref:stimulator of interferon genes protein-like n=1 Tax=Xenia sp. Carnegie-2017 TaxID=2897299 RepID=UPI001F03BA65|nr:stimulator of interferon genes protein-like [Xenia sp. Carnegie-2017]
MVEKKQLYPAYTLAWNYYFEVLENLLPIVNERFTDHKILYQYNEDAETDKRPTKCKEYIDSKKLIVIVPQDCRTHQNLEEIDSNFEKLRDVKGKGYSVPLYNVIHGNEQYKLLLLYVSQPLNTLYKMGGAERVKCLTENNLEEQVELFCNTLQDEILRKPLNQDFKEKCVVLKIKAECERSLGNGGLVKLIIERLKHDEDPSGRKHHQPFFVPPPPPQKFSSPVKPKAEKTSPLKQDEYYKETSTNNEKESPSTSEKKTPKKLEQQKNVATKANTITPKNEVGNNSENHSLKEERADDKHKQTEHVESRSSTSKSLTFSTKAQPCSQLNSKQTEYYY